MKDKELEDFMMVSFDLGKHEYCFYAKFFIDMALPGHHILMDGISKESLQVFIKLIQITNLILFFIDGSIHIMVHFQIFKIVC